jgi:hypothetical protein
MDIKDLIPTEKPTGNSGYTYARKPNAKFPAPWTIRNDRLIHRIRAANGNLVADWLTKEKAQFLMKQAGQLKENKMIDLERMKKLAGLQEAGEVHYDGWIVTILGTEADSLAKILGIKSKPDIAQKFGKSYIMYNYGDRIQFASKERDLQLGESSNSLNEGAMSRHKDYVRCVKEVVSEMNMYAPDLALEFGLEEMEVKKQLMQTIHKELKM